MVSRVRTPLQALHLFHLPLGGRPAYRGSIGQIPGVRADRAGHLRLPQRSNLRYGRAAAVGPVHRAQHPDGVAGSVALCRTARARFSGWDALDRPRRCPPEVRVLTEQERAKLEGHLLQDLDLTGLGVLLCLLHRTTPRGALRAEMGRYFRRGNTHRAPDVPAYPQPGLWTR